MCLAEPALDLGRFLAYLHVDGHTTIPRRPWPLLDELTAAFLGSYLDACAAVPERLRRAPAAPGAHRRRIARCPWRVSRPARAGS